VVRGETFSSIPTARATPLSLSLLTLSVSRIVALHIHTRARARTRIRTRMQARMCVFSLLLSLSLYARRMSLHRKLKCHGGGTSGRERGRGGTAADGPPETLRRESPEEIETARPLSFRTRRTRGRDARASRGGCVTRRGFPSLVSFFLFRQRAHPPTTYRNLTPRPASLAASREECLRRDIFPSIPRLIYFRNYNPCWKRLSDELIGMHQRWLEIHRIGGRGVIGGPMLHEYPSRS